MIDISTIDYSALDRPEILMFLFHPRPEWEKGEAPAARDVLIPVEGGAAIGGRFHMAGKSCPNILFFHGNGEIVADYDEVGPLYTGMGMNFLPVDYRGYGRSTGRPTVTAMMRDCHIVYDFVRKWLAENGHTGPFIAMGRSLGSASALELAAQYRDGIDGLAVESGFAYAGPLLRLLGMDPDAIGFREEDGFRNLDKIRGFDKPTLIIHAERDHIIPCSDGKALFDACPAARKTFVKIPGANHNDILIRGLRAYMGAVKDLSESLQRNSIDNPHG
jgi:fermentation-respiration switch protein FrsA (DUF1100 family)